MSAPTRLLVSGPVAAVITWWTGPRDLPGMEWGTTLSVWALLTAAVFGVVAITTDGWGGS